MKLKFDVTAKEYGILRDILTDMLPPDSRVWVFGSRAKNTVRFNSDIDLALEPAKGKPLPKDTIARLKDAFNDAPLPYRVDVLDINDVSENFQTIIRRQAIAFPLAKSNKVPALRFPEFRDAGDWSVDRLSNSSLTVVDGDRGVNYPQKKDFSQSGYCLFLNAKNVTKTGFSFEDTAFISQNKDGAMSKGKLNKGDILLTTRGSVGHIAIFDSTIKYEHLRINSGMVILRSTNKEDSSGFLFFLFNSPKIITQIKRISFGSAQPQLTVKEIKRFWLAKPTLPEQQKIAAFLSAIDTKIAQITKKKALLEQYKRGVMQKLFNQELRFKDAQGKAFPDWVEKRMGDFYEFKSTNSLSRDKLNYEGCGVRNIHYGDIHTKYKPAFDVRQEQVPFVNSSVDLSGISEDKYCQYGDLIIADASEDYDDIGKTIELINLNNEKVLAGLHTLLARLISKDIHIGFGTFVMACASVRRQIKIIAQGTKVLGISAGRMAKIELPMPCSEEQQKIANFLSSIDQKIDLIATELDHAKTFKKGLLQQMFI